MRSTMIVALSLVAMTATSADGQFRTNQQGARRPVSVAFGGGASVPVGNYKDVLKAGWNGQGSLIFNLPGIPIALRADLNYNKFTFENNLPFSTGDGGTVATTDNITQEILG